MVGEEMPLIVLEERTVPPTHQPGQTLFFFFPNSISLVLTRICVIFLSCELGSSTLHPPSLDFATPTTFGRYFLSPGDEISAAAGAQVPLTHTDATPQTQTRILVSEIPQS